MDINVARLGLLSYKEALEIQEKLLLLRQQGKIEDILLLVEHPPVLTLGTRGVYSNILLSEKDLEMNGVEIYKVNRGGDVTYHGPGQIVGYPIMDLNKQGKDIKDFVGKIEEIFIQLLKEEYHMEAKTGEKKYTGVWVDNAKITAIGIAVKHWVTMHGFAFNVNTQLEHFKWINPCGITDRGVTSLQKLMGSVQNFDLLNEQVVQYFCKVFDVRPVPVDINKYLAMNPD